jgi:hypothetical protein
MCTQCANMKKRNKKVAGVSGFDTAKFNVNKTLYMVLGAVAAKAADGLLKKVPIAAFQDNAILRDAVKVGLGAALQMQDNEMIADLGLGMAAYGGAKIVGSFLPANLNDAVAGMYGTGVYQNGTGPLNISGYQGGFQSLSGTGGYQGGLGTDPDAIISGMDDDSFDIRLA